MPFGIGSINTDMDSRHSSNRSFLLYQLFISTSQFLFYISRIQVNRLEEISTYLIITGLTSMDQSKVAGADHQAKRTYEDFEPFCKWHNRNDVVEVHVQGFRKEHLSVRTTHTGVLTIHGERPLDQTKSTWSRFHKEIKLPNNCDTNRVAAKFVAGVLTITMPPKVAQPAADQSPQEDDQKQRLARHEKSSLPSNSNVDNQTNNDEAIGKLIKQNHDDNPTKDEDAALLDEEEVKPGSLCKLGQRSLASSKKHIAVKVLVLVVAAVVAIGFGAYIYQIQTQPSLK